MKKLLLRYLAVLALLISSQSIFAVNLNIEEIDGMVYTLNEDGTAIVKSKTIKCSGTLIIPSTIEFSGKTYTVTGIGDMAFAGCTDVMSVQIPNSVILIDSYSFQSCSNLISIKIPDSAISIGTGAFWNCRNLTSVEIGTSVTSIGSSAFEDCKSLIYIKIPNSVTLIGASAFRGCGNLKEVLLADGEETIELCDNVFHLVPIEDLYLGRNFTHTSKVTSLWPFYGKTSLKTLTIGNSVTSIESSAFCGCFHLKSVTIPNSVTSIGSSVFSRCSDLSEVIIEDGESMLEFGSNTFDFVPIENLYVGRNYICPSMEYYNFPFYAKTTLSTLKIGDSVRTIGKCAFRGCSGLTSVEIPNSVTSIGESAFEGCSNLASIKIPTSVASIGGAAFEECSSLTTLEWPASAESIEENTFMKCSGLTSFNIPNTVRSIGEYAFLGCDGLTTVSIPNSVMSIEGSAFSNCHNLKEVSFADGDIDLEMSNFVFDGVPIENLYIGRTLLHPSKLLFSNTKSLKTLTVGNSVSSIWESAFSGCSNLTSVKIGNSVTAIEGCAFQGCESLKEVYISDGEKTIDFDADVFDSAPIETLYLGRNYIYSPSSDYSLYGLPFYGKSSLEKLTIGDTVTAIGEYAFYGCNSLVELSLGVGLKDIFTQAFGGIDMSKIHSFAKAAPKIDVTAFSSQTKLSCEVKIPEGSLSSYQRNWCTFRCFQSDYSEDETIVVTSPGNLINQISIDYAESYTRLKLIGKLNGTDLLALNKCPNIITLDLSESTIVSGGMPYYEKDNVRFGTEDNTLGEMWSYNLSQLSWIKLPGTLIRIGKKSFFEKSNLIEITIPGSITSIDEYAFDGCGSLKEVNIADGPNILEFGSCVFLNSKIETLYLGRDCICKSSRSSDYPFYGKSSLRYLTIGNTVTSIGKSAFSGCIGVPSIVIPNSVTSIEKSAFYGCNGLTSVVIGNSVASIGDYAFCGCSELKDVIFPESVTTIGTEAFNGCSNLTSIEIPNSVTTIGESAFRGCCGLTSVMLPNSISSINSSVFQDCNSLISIEIPNSVVSIGHASFMDCDKLASIEIPNSVTSIGSSAFYGCDGLMSVKLSTELTEIANSTFLGCQNLTFINIPDPVRRIGENAFASCSALDSVTLPGSLREIGTYAFSGCDNLKFVTVINPIPPVIESNTFAEASSSTLIVPEGSRNMYWIHPYWGQFGSIRTWGGNNAEETVFRAENVSYRVTSEEDRTVEITAATLIGRSADIEIPEEVIYNDNTYRVAGIANNGFENVAVSSISLPATIGYVGLEAFKGCTGLHTLICLAKTPPSVYANSFDENTYAEAALEVPEDLVSVYQKDAVWGKFNVRTLSVPISGIEINPIETNYLVGNEFTITASVYPENASAYGIVWTSSDETIATVDENGEVTVVGVGKVTITASCGEISSSCSIKCYPQTGDANWNGNISIADAVDISNYVVKKKSAPEGWDKAEWTEFYTAGANANESEDGEITFADAFAAVRLALAQPSAMPTQNRIGADDKDGNDTSDALVVERVTMTEDGKTAIAVKLDNSRDYVALQSDIFFPEGMDIEVKIGNRAASHSLETMKHDGNHIRLALFDLGNKTFADGYEPLFEIIADADLKDIENMILSNILAADADANEFALECRMTDVTGVENVADEDICIKKDMDVIHIYNAAGKMINICTMEGQTIKSFVANDNHETINLPVGIYIVKAGNKTLKVIL